MARDGGGLEVQGARNLRRTLKAAGVSVQDLKDAHAAVAELVATRATGSAPRRTGRLAASVRPAGTQREAIVRAGRSAVPYAGPIHWGWPGRGIRAQPFIAEAAEAARGAWENEYLQAIDKIIDKIEGAPGP